MLAQYLRQLARNGQHGHTRTPADYYMTGSYTSFYWDNRGVVPDHATWQRVASLSARYHSFRHYCREVLPEWRETSRVFYADNSVEAVEASAITGETRRVMVTPPSGDRCY
jgi:hypothetical protein